MRSILSMLLAAALLAPAAHAAKWQTVVRDGDQRIDIDRSRVGRLDSSRHVAWSRIAFAGAATDSASGRRLAAVEVLHHYDCRAATFAVVRRVYVGTDDAVIREERIGAPQELAVAAGSSGERLYQEVCEAHRSTETSTAPAVTARAAASKTEALPVPVKGVDPRRGDDSAPGTAAEPADHAPPAASEVQAQVGQRRVSASALQIAKAASLAAAQAQRKTGSTPAGTGTTRAAYRSAAHAASAESGR